MQLYSEKRRQSRYKSLKPLDKHATVRNQIDIDMAILMQDVEENKNTSITFKNKQYVEKHRTMRVNPKKDYAKIISGRDGTSKCSCYFFFTYIIFVKRSIDLFFSHFLSILIFFHILPHILPPLSILSFPPTQVTSLLLLPGPNSSLLFAVAMNSMLVHLSKTVVLIRTMLTNLHAVLMQPLLEETKEYVVL